MRRLSAQNGRYAQNGLFRGVAFFAGWLLTTACARPVYLENTSGAGSGERGSQKSACTTCINFLWETRPTETTFGSFIFAVVDAETRSTINAPKADSVKVELWMPSMGHGSSPVTIEKLSEGLYRASRVYFSMGGDWEIRFQFFNNAVKTDEATLHLVW